MQNSGGGDPLGRMTYSLHSLNEGSDDSEANVSGASGFSSGGKRSADDAGLEPESIGISSDDDLPSGGKGGSDPPKKTPPPNGKKTKGRVKIKMEFIDNKLRRYTTFSKRKTGIMKKAYELSTLTGTQVMLLVASETGHVYTFATRKLQPMITSEAGKALIQTCLNSPDPPVGHSQQLDQRMSATGFEETDLTYSITEEDQKEAKPQVIFGTHAHMEGSNNQNIISQTSSSTSIPVTTILNSQSTNKATNISMQLQPAAGYAAILASGSLPPGTPLQIGTLPTHSQNQQVQQQQNNSQAATLYRLPHQPVMSISSISNSSSHQSNNSENMQNTVTVVPTTQQNLSVVSGNMVIPASGASTTNAIPGTVMYQTAQGVVYATPTTATLPEGMIFNFGQGTTLQIPHDQGGSSTPQQYITIPVPVSLTAAAPQIMHAQPGLSPTTSSSSSEPSSSPGVTDLSKSSSRK